MITIEDCKAFCDADLTLVNELARRESLPMLQAFACAHAVTRCANDGYAPSLPARAPILLAA